MKRLTIGALLGGLLLLGALSFGQDPVEDISAGRHPNLAAAQHFIRQAYDKISVAQKDNKYDMQDHGQKAKDLLDQASKELKLAAEAADHNKK